MDAFDIFIPQFQKGPICLFLGQNYLSLETGSDPYLTEIVKKYSTSTDTTPTNYEKIWELKNAGNTETTLAWMHSRSERLSTPLWLTEISLFPWNNIYSSAIDSMWTKAFKNEWREVNKIFSDDYRPSDPRNRLRLHCTYLYGSVSRSDETENPPLNFMQYTKRRQIAIALARRIPEIVTPLGTLIIEGYSDEDWFKIEDLYPIIDELGEGQVYLFSASNNIKDNIFIRTLVDSGKLVLFRESLALTLSRALDAGYINIEQNLDNSGNKKIRIGGKLQSIPTSLWNQVIRSATVVEEKMFIDVTPLSPNKKYQEFRAFLSNSETVPIWSAYPRGFALARDFEAALFQKIENQLKSSKLQKRPIILHGQTGTGKTVALGSLAHKIYTASGNRYPVLFIERKSERPTYSDIDNFCNWAEDNGAHASLIIWDGMHELDQYNDLLHFLSGRGRKVVLVGSSYSIRTSDKSNLIEAPGILSPNEREHFRKHLNSIEPTLSEFIDRYLPKTDETFLVALYRVLPETRAIVGAGVQKEVVYTEKLIMKSPKGDIEINYNNLQYALINSGLAKEENTIAATKTEYIGDVEVGEFQKLVGLIMVPGRFGLKVPIDIFIRVLGRQRINEFFKIVESSDIFRWHEDSIGNISIGPRHPLEAKLIVQRNLGGPLTEVAFIKQLLLETRISDRAADNDELQFTIDLVRSVGPNGHDAPYFQSFYQDISKTLTFLRTEKSITHPRLMLQEAYLLRESTVCNSNLNDGEKNQSDKVKVLKNAEHILREALSSCRDYRNPKLRSAILVELANVLGYIAISLVGQHEKSDILLNYYKELKLLTSQARAIDPENFYPVDVVAWVTRDLIKSHAFSPSMMVEVEADILNTFEMTQEEDLSIDKKDRFHQRRMELTQLINRSDLTAESFEALASLGSSAGYYLKAFEKMGMRMIKAGKSSDGEVARYYNALQYLDENRDKIRNDGRCMHLLLKLWWTTKTGLPPFSGERQTVPFSEADWLNLLHIVLDIQNIGGTFYSFSMKFLYAMASFHLGDLATAFDVFQKLDRETDAVYGKRRILKSYLASTPEGNPYKYSGTVSFISKDGNKGEIYVDELRRKVIFLPKDFGRPNIQCSENVNDFHIAFNFIGPIADSPYFFSEKGR